MQELFQLSTTPYTLPVTIVLVLCLIYWGFVILGALDIDAIDFGGGGETDVDFDVDVPTGGWWHSVVEFFNLVEIPGMVFLSILSLAMWFIQVNLDSAFNAFGAFGVGVGFLFCSLVGGLFVTKLVTQPLKPLFLRLNEGEAHISIIGQEGIVKSAQVNHEYGQVEVAKSGAPLLLNARTGEGGEPIENGERVIVFDEDKEQGIYLVRKLTRRSIHELEGGD